MAHPVGSEEGGAGGGDGRGEEKTGTKTIEEKCGSQEIKAQNDEGRCESKGTEDIVTESKKPGGQGMVKKVANKEENTKNTGVFNDAEWEFGKDNKTEGEEKEQELTGGVTSRIKFFETVEVPKPQRVMKKPERVLKNSKGAKRNQKLVGDAFNSEGVGKVSEKKATVKQQPGSILGKAQSTLGGTQVAAEKLEKNLTKGGKGGNPLEAECEDREENQETAQSTLGGIQVAAEKLDKNLTKGGKGGNPLEAECEDREENQAKKKVNQGSSLRETLSKESRVEVKKQRVEKPKGTGKLTTVEEEEADHMEDTNEAFAALLDNTGGDENENSSDKTKGISEATIGKPVNRSTPRKTGAGRGEEITDQELKERGIPRQLGPTGLLREEAEERGGIYDEQGELQGLRDNQIVWAPGEDHSERGNDLVDQRDEIGSWAKEKATNYQPEEIMDWQKEREHLRERMGYSRETMKIDGGWKGDAGKVWQNGQREQEKRGSERGRGNPERGRDHP